jgi:hypothetical protein
MRCIVTAKIARPKERWHVNKHAMSVYFTPLHINMISLWREGHAHTSDQWHMYYRPCSQKIVAYHVQKYSITR